ncbi:hypothetical protein F4859DRAFT_509927 [Xylaria cf. heliscus]|nr:hypothetical protein F4859DRAFT_509927 [Xylaria cf. heliscus]
MAQSSSHPSHYLFGRDHKSSIRYIQRVEIWLAELSDALPENSQLHGFDISRDQYPPKEWLPKNVSLHEHDAFKPFPAQFLGTFDVVNLRFFITLLNTENIQRLLSNLKALLTRAITIRPGLKTPRTESVVSMMRELQPDVDLWLAHYYTDLFKTAGLCATIYERVQLRDHLRPLWNHSHLMAMEEFYRRTSQNTEGRDDKLPSSLIQQLSELETEFAQGASIDAQWFLMIGNILGTQK